MASSQKRISGLLARARAIATRWRSPPERRPAGLCALSDSPTRERSSPTLARISVLLQPAASRGKATLPDTVLEEKRLKFWKTNPAFLRASRRACPLTPDTGLPENSTSPESARSRSEAILISVVFPAPLRPIMPDILPAGTSSEMSSSTSMGAKGFADLSDREGRRR